MAMRRNKISEYLGSQAFMDAAKIAVEDAIAQANAHGLPKAYNPLPENQDVYRTGEALNPDVV